MVGKTAVAGTAIVANTVTDRPFRLIHQSGRIFDFNSNVLLGVRTTSSVGEPQRWRKISLVDDRLVAESLVPGGNIDVPWSDVKAGVMNGMSFGRGAAVAGGIGAVAGLVVLLAGLASQPPPGKYGVSTNLGTILGGVILGNGVLWLALSPLFGWNLDADE